jgi:hypothetical protein
MKNIVLTLLLFISTYLTADEKEENLKYQTPDKFEFVTNVGDDMLQLWDKSIDSDNLSTWGIIAGSTLLLYYFDEELIAESKRLGKKLDIPPHGDSVTTTRIGIGPFPIIKTTSDKGAMLYMIGDGLTHITIMSGFFTYGMISDDNKALSVSSQLAEGLVDVAIVTQVLKHITGRQSPFKSTQKRGKWDLFPNQEDYIKDVPSYDAFPSGHLATTMMTVTILAENYPNNAYIKPVGYTAMTLLAFQMLNNEVHWASDYPLAIGIGYSIGQIISKRERHRAKKGFTLVPKITPNYNGVALQYKF